MNVVNFEQFENKRKVNAYQQVVTMLDARLNEWSYRGDLQRGRWAHSAIFSQGNYCGLNFEQNFAWPYL